MKFTITTALLTLLATSISAASIPLEARAGSRTVVLTNEYTGRGTPGVIPTTGADLSVKGTYPAVYVPSFRVDSVMITSGVVTGAKCVIKGKTRAGKPVQLVEVNGERNYARFPKDADFVPETLQINCV
ncbi:hypothetical protein BJX66DRAFT_337759 [Aspergillus keveii]|jgi:hypothetical protein|uniref:Uncharacterized protein n=1 Tax=Aspergillus keveii TaxID=714993 RepID=A0ABR4G6G7_9EURO